MTPEDRSRLKGLLAGQRLLALGVVVDREAVVGLLPYAPAPDFTALVVQASRLAPHAEGLKAGARWSGVVHEPDSPDADPLQIARLVLEGEVDPLSGSDSRFEAAARAYLSRFPGAARTLSLPDFKLYRLQLDGGRMILGFGRALNLSKSLFSNLELL